MISGNVKVRIIETSDVHGCYFPYDFINQRDTKGSLARVHSFVTEQRSAIGDSNVIVVDNGDFLQGQPIAYFYNYIDTVSRHPGAEMLDFMGYDFVTLGNHDIESGHSVFDRWIRDLSQPVLGANIIDLKTSEPYVEPYAVKYVDGLRIAFIGMITPGIPGWLPENLWSGMIFEDMVETAKKWVPIIKEKENPHLIIGLFHSGRDSTKLVGSIPENQSLCVARNVPGFDAVLMGHDHSLFCDFIDNVEGAAVLAANPANNADNVIVIEIDAEIDDDDELSDLRLNAFTQPMSSYAPSNEFLERFSREKSATENFVNETVGTMDRPLYSRDAFFGPSSFMDLIHEMQLAISGAQISLGAPLSYDAIIEEGDITVADMFNLYKYENLLYTLLLSGKEIKDYLEMSYDLWINTMSDPSDHLLKINDAASNDMTHTGFVNPSYNFDSAAGLIYTVDVTKPKGEKINIISMGDGTPFEPEEMYTVAMNSYRGNGGGNLLTEGAGLSKDEIKRRLINSTDRDLRYYLMQYIKERGTVTVPPLNQWKFIPENIVYEASQRDKSLLFPE